MSSPKLPPERIELILKTYEDTGSIQRTALETGHAQGSVRKVLHHHNIDTAQSNASTRVPKAIPEGKVSDEELLRSEVQQLRTALTKSRKGDVATERIIASVERALDDIAPTPVFTPPAKVRGAEKAHHRQLALWSDWHGGEQVDPDTVMKLNDYDWGIQEQRVDEMLHGILSHKKNSPEVTGIDIGLIGDMCSGANHRELAVTNQYPLAEQGVKMGYLIGRAIEYLAPHYEEIRVFSVVGNHPRLVVKPAAKDTHDNMDWVAAIIAKEYLKYVETVTSFVVGRTSLLHEIAGRNIYVFHGDGIKSSMPGVPWGGVMRRVNEIGRIQPVRIDHYALGHFHDPNVVQGGRILMNGSLKGVDEWVLKNFGGGSPPTQILTTFDEKRSRMTDVKFLTPGAGLRSG